MVEERKKMELNGLSAPVLGGEERSDEVPSTGASSSRLAPPDPEVVAKPKRRRFTAEYRLRIVEEADRCSAPGARRCRPAASPGGAVQLSSDEVARGPS